MQRLNVSSGGPWEAKVAYSRAVRVGSHVWVAGTTATRPDGTVEAPGDAFAQTQAALATVVAALREAGAGPEHVVRTRLFVTDIAQWDEVGRAHAAVFRDVRPAATMVEVHRLIHPDLVVEVEAEAFVPPA